MNHKIQHTYTVGCCLLLIILLSGCKRVKQASNASTMVQSTNATKVNPTFLFLSDIHLDTQSDSTIMGNDTGMDLWNNFLQKADLILAGSNSPQFVIYTGDLPAHYSCDTCKPHDYLAPNVRGSHNNNLTVILTGLRTLANKYHKPFFYIPGNNDGLAGDYFSFADEQQQTPLSLVPDNSNPYPALNTHASGNTPPYIVANNNAAMDYYAVVPETGLRLICLNTVLYTKNFTTVDGSDKTSDRDSQMTWLASQLSAANALHEKVYIAMHVPPGIDAYSGHNTLWDDKHVNYQNIFLSLVAQYQTSIAGIFYGHTHMDEMRRLYDSLGSITEVAISCPGVTPQHKNNPGFKTISYDPASKEVTDFTTYYTHLASQTWGDSTYTFSTIFNDTSRTNIYKFVAPMQLSDLSQKISEIYTVMNGAPAYNITTGIEVKWGQK